MVGCRTDALSENTYVNATSTDITSLCNTTATGSAWRSLVHSDDLSEVLSQWTDAIINGMHYRLRHRIVHEGGEIAWLSVHAAPMRQEGRIVGYIGIVQDVTHTHHTEEKLRLARDEAEAASAAKSAFLASMSHELRTPLTAILGFVDILSVNLLRPEDVEAAQTVKRNAECLLALINDILDLSKIEAGKMDSEFMPLANVERCASARWLLGRAVTARVRLRVADHRVNRQCHAQRSGTLPGRGLYRLHYHADHAWDFAGDDSSVLQQHDNRRLTGYFSGAPLGHSFKITLSEWVPGIG